MHILLSGIVTSVRYWCLFFFQYGNVI